jgi:ubiquitin-conjugating enzyme E2 D/E
MARKLKMLDKQILLLEQNAETTKLSITLISADDPNHYQATIRGPVDSLFEGGLYLLDVQFSDEYPFKPPKIKFLTRIFHPNIREDGAIYLNNLYDQWTPTFTIEKVLLAIQSLLTSPDTDVSMTGNKEAARLYLHDRNKYDQHVRLYTQKYTL